MGLWRSRPYLNRVASRRSPVISFLNGDGDSVGDTCWTVADGAAPGGSSVDGLRRVLAAVEMGAGLGHGLVAGVSFNAFGVVHGLVGSGDQRPWSVKVSPGYR